MTKEEALLISAYTGYPLVKDFADVHKFCEETLGRQIWTHEFAIEDLHKKIRLALKPKIKEMIEGYEE